MKNSDLVIYTYTKLVEKYRDTNTREIKDILIDVEPYLYIYNVLTWWDFLRLIDLIKEYNLRKKPTNLLKEYITQIREDNKLELEERDVIRMSLFLFQN